MRKTDDLRDVYFNRIDKGEEVSFGDLTVVGTGRENRYQVISSGGQRLTWVNVQDYEDPMELATDLAQCIPYA